MQEGAYWYWLCNRKELGAVKIRRLVEAFGSPEAVFEADLSALIAKGRLSERDAQEVVSGHGDLAACEEGWKWLPERGIRMLDFRDPAFPSRLALIPNPPACLFIKGRLPSEEEPTAAVVGARDCTIYGKGQAEKIAGELAAAGCWVVSGLAYGIDGAAHRGALRARGRTCAVLGCGVDICYPQEHYFLYEEILQKGGGIVSEFAPGTPPAARNFPIRNRLISGLADAVVVMEARKRSGSLITVERALEQGKEIFAFPGRISDPLSAGCLELLRDGAHILTGSGDVLEALHLDVKKSLNNSEEVQLTLAEDEKLVYSAIAYTPKHLDEILEEVYLSASQIYAALLSLELQGVIRQTVRNYYERVDASAGS